MIISRQQLLMCSLLILLTSLKVWSFKITGNENLRIELFSKQIADTISYHFQEYQFVVIVVDSFLTTPISKSILFNLQHDSQIPLVLVSNLKLKVWSLLIQTIGDVHELGKSDAFVIIIEEQETLLHSISMLEKHPQWNSRAKILVFTMKENFSNRSFERIFEVSWREKKILNMKIFTMNNMCQSESRYETFTWCLILIDHNPFCEDEGTKYQLINNLDSVKSLNLFQDKTMHLCGYPITASWFESVPYMKKAKSLDILRPFEGNFGKMFETQAKIMNFTIVPHIYWSTPAAGVYIAYNNTWNGVIGDILYGRADISPSPMTLTYHRNLFVDFTYEIYIDDIVFAVPAAPYVPKWQYLKEPFSRNLWLLLTLVFISISIFKLCHGCVQRQLNTKCTDNVNALKIFSILLSISVSRLPRNDLLRIVIILWTLLILVVNSLYQGSLLSYIRRPRHLPEIDTFVSLANSGLKALTISSYISLITESSSQELRSLTPRTNPIVSIHKGLMRVSHERDTSFLFLRAVLELYRNVEFVDADGNPLFHIVGERLSQVLMCHIVRKGSPYLPRLNEIIRRSTDAGLKDKWLNDFIRDSTLIFTDTEEHIFAFTLWYLQIAFFVISIGLVLATMAFCAELVAIDKRFRKTISNVVKLCFDLYRVIRWGKVK